MARETGTVKWFNESKGYGFIVGPDGLDLFVHYSEIRGEGFRNLKENQQVSYDIGSNAKGLSAVDVEVLGY